MPDITLAPALASYFGVSMDVLFDFNLQEIEDKAFAIAKESWKYRSSDWEKARSIIDEGLKTYPDSQRMFHNCEHAAARFGLADAGNIYGRLTNSTQDVLYLL